MKKYSNELKNKQSKNIFIRFFRRLFFGKKKKTGSTYPLR